jgi:hypothetical protein
VRGIGGQEEASAASTLRGSFSNEMTNDCLHFGHFARLPSFSRKTLNEALQFGHAAGDFAFIGSLSEREM